MYFFNKNFLFENETYWNWKNVKFFKVENNIEFFDIDTQEEFNIAEMIWPKMNSEVFK